MQFEFVGDRKSFTLPPLDVLECDKTERSSLDKEVFLTTAEKLRAKLADFGITGEVVEIRPGPVVTMYEFLPGPGPRDRLPQGDCRAGRLPQIELKTDDVLGQGHRGDALRARSGAGATFAHRRYDRIRQIGGGQLDDHEHSAQIDAGRGAVPHGGSEDARVVRLRGHPASAFAGSNRSEEGGLGVALGGGGNGAPVPGAFGGGGPQHRRIQQAGGELAPLYKVPASIFRAAAKTQRHSSAGSTAGPQTAGGGRGRRRNRR